MLNNTSGIVCRYFQHVCVELSNVKAVQSVLDVQSSLQSEISVEGRTVILSRPEIVDPYTGMPLYPSLYVISPVHNLQTFDIAHDKK